MGPLLPWIDGRSNSRRQRGAMSTMAAVWLSTTLAAALLAVDLGNLFYTKRKLQAVADTAALSAVNNLPSALTLARDTATANDFIVPPVPGEHDNQLTTVNGKYDFQARSFDDKAPAVDHNAVAVTVTTEQPYFFMIGSRQISATATAARTDIAGFSVGSGLLAIDTSQSALLDALLGKMLGTSVKLKVSSYDGLLNTNVRLLDLVNAQGSVGTVNELLKLDLTVEDLLRLTLKALNQTDIAAVDARAFGSIQDLLDARIPGGLHLTLADLLDASLAPGNTAAETQINVFQLITLAAQVANGKNFVNIPALDINLGGLATLDAKLSMIEPPQIALGPVGQARAHTAQWRLKLDLKLLELLEGSLVHLPLYLEIAPAEARLKGIECAWPRENSIVTIDASSSLSRVYIGEVNADAMTNFKDAATVDDAKIVSLTGLLGLTGVLDVTTRVALDLPGGSGDLQFSGPFGPNNTKTVSGLSTGGMFEKLGSNMKLDIELLGIKLGLGSALGPLLKLLAPVFQLLDSLLAPVLQLLGIQLGYADVTNFALKCGAPQLVR